LLIISVTLLMQKYPVALAPLVWAYLIFLKIKRIIAFNLLSKNTNLRGREIKFFFSPSASCFLDLLVETAKQARSDSQREILGSRGQRFWRESERWRERGNRWWICCAQKRRWSTFGKVQYHFRFNYTNQRSPLSLRLPLSW
jgi:hypothetical protein